MVLNGLCGHFVRLPIMHPRPTGGRPRSHHTPAQSDRNNRDEGGPSGQTQKRKPRAQRAQEGEIGDPAVRALIIRDAHRLIGSFREIRQLLLAHRRDIVNVLPAVLAISALVISAHLIPVGSAGFGNSPCGSIGVHAKKLFFGNGCVILNAFWNRYGYRNYGAFRSFSLPR